MKIIFDILIIITIFLLSSENPKEIITDSFAVRGVGSELPTFRQNESAFYKEFRMGKRKDDLVLKRYEYYQQGSSLAMVGKKFGVSRQTVYECFINRGFELREKKELPFIIFNNIKFTIYNSGYYRRTDGNRELLHRYTWIFYNGLIPKGYDIHHKDYNKLNNKISNLGILLNGEHTILHHKEKQNARKS